MSAHQIELDDPNSKRQKADVSLDPEPVVTKTFWRKFIEILQNRSIVKIVFCDATDKDNLCGVMTQITQWRSEGYTGIIRVVLTTRPVNLKTIKAQTGVGQATITKEGKGYFIPFEDDVDLEMERKNIAAKKLLTPGEAAEVEAQMSAAHVNVKVLANEEEFEAMEASMVGYECSNVNVALLDVHGVSIPITESHLYGNLLVDVAPLTGKDDRVVRDDSEALKEFFLIVFWKAIRDSGITGVEMVDGGYAPYAGISAKFHFPDWTQYCAKGAKITRRNQAELTSVFAEVFAMTPEERRAFFYSELAEVKAAAAAENVPKFKTMQEVNRELLRMKAENDNLRFEVKVLGPWTGFLELLKEKELAKSVKFVSAMSGVLNGRTNLLKKNGGGVNFNDITDAKATEFCIETLNASGAVVLFVPTEACKPERGSEHQLAVLTRDQLPAEGRNPLMKQFLEEWKIWSEKYGSLQLTPLFDVVPTLPIDVLLNLGICKCDYDLDTFKLVLTDDATKIDGFHAAGFYVLYPNPSITECIKAHIERANFAAL